MEISTSMTGTSFEYGSVIVKHLNRRPLASRSWLQRRTLAQSPWPTSIRAGWAAAARRAGPPWPSSGLGGATRDPPHDRAARSSCDSPSSLPGAAAHRGAGAPIPPLGLSNRSHSRSKFAIVPSAATISQRVPIQVHQLAHPSLTQPKARDDLLSRRPLRLGPYQFFAVIAFSAWMSNACSATICFNRRFSSSS